MRTHTWNDFVSLSAKPLNRLVNSQNKNINKLCDLHKHMHKYKYKHIRRKHRNQQCKKRLDPQNWFCLCNPMKMLCMQQHRARTYILCRHIRKYIKFLSIFYSIVNNRILRWVWKYRIWCMSSVQSHIDLIASTPNMDMSTDTYARLSHFPKYMHCKQSSAK